jgi:hypothetical protein
MLTDWSALCSPEDPILVVPWSDPATNVSWIDLRADPYDFDGIPEAVQYPALLQALRALNANRSPVFTAKCDVWSLAADEIGSLRLELGLEPTDSRASIASYIDLISREKSTFASAAQQQQWINRFLRLASTLEHPTAAAECILRSALLDLEQPQEGYAVSLYVKALGPDRESVVQAWSTALVDVVSLIRARELAR